jgi:hypothetical protein
MRQKLILGHVTEVAIQSLGLNSIIAKVDTGAFSGALHCTDVSLSKDKKVLSFNPLGKEDLRLDIDIFEIRTVRSASGHEEERFLVPVTIQLAGKDYDTMIGLTDRSDMGYEMLLGRRFLREHHMVVDVTLNEEYDEEWRRLHS